MIKHFVKDMYHYTGDCENPSYLFDDPGLLKMK